MTPWWGGWSGVTWCLWVALCSQAHSVPMVTSSAQGPMVVTIFQPAPDLKQILQPVTPHFTPAWVWLRVLSFPPGPVLRWCWPAAPPTPWCRAPRSPWSRWPAWAQRPICPVSAGDKSNKTLSGDGAQTDTGRLPQLLYQVSTLSSSFFTVFLPLSRRVSNCSKKCGKKSWKLDIKVDGTFSFRNFQFGAKKIDVFSRFGFPFVFFIFNIWYWSYYLTREHKQTKS